eukprot:GCRY01000769.1.p1 GENE.GCRY01000769.1~~GCRY01000769.1.p1  ORF type:complete len:140 (+),score=9.76 GCRY01000769.1:148-567(+)
MFGLSDYQKIGAGLTAAGCAFVVLGVMFFLDRGLLAMGNLLFVGGVMLLMGMQRTMNFFLRKQKLKGTACFVLGIILVLWGWCFFGILVEGFGFINLFGNFFPHVLDFLRSMPFIGTVLSAPGIKHVLDRLFGSETFPV